ncbi:hypothetical protein MESS2_580006 [Mesorhizobium metallidurans STM 2683]|uniref:Uncharacterized protein n=1 Tax=Mesorhizobium metallidurans STM 2683 TaxID=1297569 RepID=M5EU81_9HYPH|nr:hypothetical protein MESS2_580006 [Mesorhizobium metallidurans STM 2683]
MSLIRSRLRLLAAHSTDLGGRASYCIAKSIQTRCALGVTAMYYLAIIWPWSRGYPVPEETETSPSDSSHMTAAP